jgi:hypothetical protein
MRVSSLMRVQTAPGLLIEVRHTFAVLLLVDFNPPVTGRPYLV